MRIEDAPKYCCIYKVFLNLPQICIACAKVYRKSLLDAVQICDQFWL